MPLSDVCGCLADQDCNDILANCCCDCFGCVDCEHCRRGIDCGRDDDSPPFCVGPAFNPDCCGCAPECYGVVIGGMTVNEGRDCFDCCFNPDTFGPCAPGDQCDDCLIRFGLADGAGICAPFPPNPPVCIRKFNCKGSCPDDKSCGWANGVHIIKSPFECAWTGRKTEPDDSFPTNCCTGGGGGSGLAWAHCRCGQGLGCGLRENETCTCSDCSNFPPCVPLCPDPEPPCNCCALSAPDPNPCTDFGSFDECINHFCADDTTVRSPCSSEKEHNKDCHSPYDLFIQSFFSPVGSVLTWILIVSFIEDDDWTFAQVKDFGIDSIPLYSFACDVETTFDKVDEPDAPFCTWDVTELSIFAAFCPAAPFWMTPKPLFYEKAGDKYISFRELKRRKWMQSFETRIEKRIALNEELTLGITSEELLRSGIKAENEKLGVSAPQLDHPFIRDIHKAIEKRLLKKMGKIRIKREIAEIYDNICQNCTYFDNDFCILKAKPVRRELTYDNFLTNAEASCPDYPPRWGASKALEDPKLL